MIQRLRKTKAVLVHLPTVLIYDHERLQTDKTLTITVELENIVNDALFWLQLERVSIDFNPI